MRFKKLFNKIYIIVICIFVFTFSFANASDVYLLYNYSPKDNLKNSNTTIEGGRFSYDALKAQNYLFNGGYPKDKEKIVFLTFDDGPSIDNTPKVLDILKEKGVKATFFILGINLTRTQKHKDILKRTFNEGHAIANHGFSHDYSYLYPNRVINDANLMEDMNKSLSIMKEVLGNDFHTRVWRLPGGIRSWKRRDEVLKNLNNQNYAVIEWNSLSGDAEGKKVRDPNVLVQNAIKTAGKANCVVLLMHDFAGEAGNVSVKALPYIIDYFKQEGYQFRTLS